MQYGAILAHAAKLVCLFQIGIVDPEVFAVEDHLHVRAAGVFPSDLIRLLVKESS